MPVTIPFLIVAAIIGLLVGSFLNVCIYRIPYGRPKGPPGWDDEESVEEKDIVEEPPEHKLTVTSPRRSFCPSCKTQLLWWHNIPVISWLLLRGRCHFCKERISARYPLVELLSCIAAVACVIKFGVTPTALLIYIFVAVLIVISFIDIDYYIIPDVISLPGTVIGFALGALNGWLNIFEHPVAADWWMSFLGILLGGGVLLIISEAYLRIRKREGLGLGDVKLLALTGALFGIEGALYTMFIGSLLGSVLGIILILLSGKKMTYQLPFGPYLAVGTVIYLFAMVP